MSKYVDYIYVLNVKLPQHNDITGNVVGNNMTRCLGVGVASTEVTGAEK